MTSPSVQRRINVPNSLRNRQKAVIILARKISRAESGVAIRLLQVSRSFSAMIPSTTNPATLNMRKKDNELVMDLRKTLKSTRARSAG